MRKMIEDQNRKFVRFEDENGVQLIDNPFGHIYFDKGHWFADDNLSRMIAHSRFERYDEQIHRYIAKTKEALLTVLQTAINPPGQS